ncbi:MAG: hypothetical protein ACKPIZ_21005 [Microcystis panniformis]
MSAAEAIRLIAPGHRVFVHGSAATPLFLLNELSSQAPRLTNVELTAVSTLGQLDITKPEFKDKFYLYFVTTMLLIFRQIVIFEYY